MMVASVLPGSFVVIFHVVETIAGCLGSIEELPHKLFVKYNVQSLKIDGNTLYQMQKVKSLFFYMNVFCD